MKDYITVVDGKKRRIRDPQINTDDVFCGKYKGFQISVNKVANGDFYVVAENSEIPFGVVYDGYYTDTDHTIMCVKKGLPITPFNIESAIQDAIRNILI